LRRFFVALHVDEEDGERDAEAGGEAGEDEKGGIAGTAFESAEVGLVEAGFLRQFGLAHVPVGPEVAHPLAEQAKHTITVRRCGKRHRRRKGGLFFYIQSDMSPLRFRKKVFGKITE
jgi:hypothetical protein